MNKVALAITGGGTEAISMLLKKGGGSNFLIDAQVPYSEASLKRYLNCQNIPKYCSMEVASAMATMAFINNYHQGGFLDNQVYGIGVTASLAKHNEREGRTHKAYIVVSSYKEIARYEIFRFKSNKRIEQEKELATFIHDLVKFTIKDPKYKYVKYTPEYTKVDTAKVNFNILPITGKSIFKQAIYSGSFNPFHKGHMAILKSYKDHFGYKPTLEISLLNDSKLPIDIMEAAKRINNIRRYPDIDKYIDDIVVTTTPKYVDKINKCFYDECHYLLGSDTLTKLVNDKEAIDLIERGKIGLVVFPRYGHIIDTSRCPRNTIILHNPLEQEVSSTEIRNSINKNG